MADPSSLLSTLDQVMQKLRMSQRQTPFVPTLEETGTIIQVENGVAFVEGLPHLQLGELIKLSAKHYGLVFHLEEKKAGVILLDRTDRTEVGMHAKRSGQVLEIGVGEELLGRCIDPLGRPLDQKAPLAPEKRRAAQRPAPSLIERLPVTDPLLSGIAAIDAMIPIGRGQRELILGDRQTGKTAIAIDTILNQRGQNVICIFCAIGKETAEIQRVVQELEEHGALDYTIVMGATGKETPGLNFIAPYCAMAIAEEFMEKGRDTLVIFDDLTRHAWSYRELSLLLRRPPTREAYPGDIFFIHSRLLERATKLKKEYGGGSITALPIIETQEQNISAYIPTNLISITDGQVYLSPKLYGEGMLPAIDVSKSISRVGGKTQLPSYRKITKDLRLAYSQYQELESFARFGTRLDEQTKKKIERGKRVRETLKQNRLDPLPIADQMALLLALTHGLFDAISLEHLPKIKEKIRRRIYEDLPKMTAKMNRGEELSEKETIEFLDQIAGIIHT